MDLLDGHSPVQSISDAVRKGRLRAIDVTANALARVEAGHGLGAFVHIDQEAALLEAQAVDARIAVGERLPLAGVPFGVKDVISVSGRPVTHGSRLHMDHVPSVDAVAVARLRAAGAIVLGMTATSEFACKGVTTSPLYGPTRHHLDPHLTPGGSSGGSAVAVAAGMVPLALGTDSGGSARRPAAHCGIVGFKPSYGAVPNGPGLPGASFGINCVSPMTRSVSDAARAFAVMSGPDPDDPDSRVLLAPDKMDARAMRVATTLSWGFGSPVDEEISDSIQFTIGQLRSTGVRIAQRDPVWPDGADESRLMPLQHAALASLYGEAFRKTPDLFDPDIAVQIDRGLALPATSVAKAMQFSQAIKRAVAAMFADADIVIGPTVPCAAWPIEQLGPAEIGGRPVSSRAHAAFTPFFNHGGNPAISIPIRPAPSGLPIGLQIVGPRGYDMRVLRFAAFMENVLANSP